MTAAEVLRIRVEPEFKDKVVRMYQQRGTTVSHEVRAFLARELAANTSAVSVFDSIMASADEKVQASGYNEPTIDDINDYIARVRAERVDDALA